MVIVRRALILASVVALLAAPATVGAQRGNTGRGGRGGGGLTDAQRKAIQSILSLADDAAAGRPAPNDLSLVWVHDDLLKVQQEGQAFVPFIVTLDPAKVTPGPVSVYWRVVSKTAPPPPAATDKDKKNDKNAPPEPQYAYESLTSATITAGQPPTISRSFTTAAGSYDVYVVVKEGSPTDTKKPEKNAPAPKASVIKQSVTVPDLWNGELNTSSVIIAEKLAPLPAPLSPQEKISRPYALGTIEIVPYTRTKFAKKEELDAFILIYNAKTDPANKPDVKVEFNFFTKQAGGEKFFNATLPTNLNGQTLSPQDLTAGQLQAGQAVPLASFPEGDYRLEIKVTDNVAKKEVKRDVNFSVSGS
jgi:hypothetical protein